MCHVMWLVALLVGLSGAAAAAEAQDDQIRFAGAVVEPTCAADANVAALPSPTGYALPRVWQRACARMQDGHIIVGARYGLRVVRLSRRRVARDALLRKFVAHLPAAQRARVRLATRVYL